jgi:hypothetical protein
MKRPYSPVALEFSKSWTVAQIDYMEARYAALIDLIQSARPVRKWRADVHGSLIASAKRQGLVSETAGGFRVTDAGCAWRESFQREPAEYEALKPVAGEGRKKYVRKPTPKPEAAPAPKETPASLARAIVADGLLFIHPDMIEGPRALNGDELKLWTLCMKYRRAPLSLADVAHKLAETVAVTRIRAERIIEKRYALPLKQDDAA